MTRQVLQRSPAVKARQPLLNNDKNAPRGRRRAGEMAGGAAAECAAIFCCCPVAVMKLLVLAVYKAPAGLCKKAIRRRKPQQRMLTKQKKELLARRSPIYVATDNIVLGTTLEEHLASEMKKKANVAEQATSEMKKDAEVAEKGNRVSEDGELEKGMWAQFQGTGFWRRPSRAEPKP